MRIVSNTGLALGLALSVPVIQAHHSISATFDITEETTVEGVVDRMSFANPHVTVIFSVTDENGEQQDWMAEGAAATLLRREGWDRDSLQNGQHVRISGFPSRNGSPMVLMLSADLLDAQSGAVLGAAGTGVSGVAETTTTPMQLANGLPNLTGAWTRRAGGGPVAENARAAGRRAAGLGGPGGPDEPGGPGGSGGPGGGAPIPYNEVGAALQAEYDPLDDPRLRCEPGGLVRTGGSTPHPVRVEQFDDRVVIYYAESGDVRTVYFDDRDLVGGEHSLTGQSIARYEDQKLIIETTHLLADQSSGGGNFLSDRTTTVETFQRMSDADGSSVLAMEMIVTDPGYLTEPWVRGWQKYYNEGYEFVDVDCHSPLDIYSNQGN